MILHPAITLLNAGAIGRKDDFKFYRDGISPEIVNIVKKIDKERC